MRRPIILLTLLFTLFSCKVSEKPEFISVENIALVESNKNSITIKADALFKNPNAIGGKLWTDEIKVFVNGNKMATVSTKTFDVPPKDEFTIPLVTKIATDSVLSNKNLSSILGSILSQRLEVQYKGDIKYRVFGFSHKYAVDKTENVKIKL